MSHVHEYDSTCAAARVAREGWKREGGEGVQTLQLQTLCKQRARAPKEPTLNWSAMAIRRPSELHDLGQLTVTVPPSTDLTCTSMKSIVSVGCETTSVRVEVTIGAREIGI